MRSIFHIFPPVNPCYGIPTLKVGGGKKRRLGTNFIEKADVNPVVHAFSINYITGRNVKVRHAIGTGLFVEV